MKGSYTMNTINRSYTLNTLPTLKAAAPADASPAPTPNVELKGSNCPGIAACQRVTFKDHTSANDKFQISVVLKRPQDLKFQPRLFDKMSTTEFAKYGAKPEQIANIEKFAKANGLSVTSVDPRTRVVKLSGTQSQYEKAFGVNLGNYQDKDGNVFRGYEGNLKMPKDVASDVNAVLGLQNRPIARPHTTPFQVKHDGASNTSYTPLQIADMYHLPKGTDGSGQTIAIIELGGGYNPDEIKSYFQKLGLPMPDIKDVNVDGGSNSPTGDPNSADGEVALDIEVAGAIAPKAKIRVYFASPTDQGFLDALNQAVHDKDNPATQVSISWGGPESVQQPQSMQAFNDALKDAAALGVNVFCAAGDNGSPDGVSDGKDHADFPGSSPWAISAGGTNIQTSKGQITKETVWNDGVDPQSGQLEAGGGGFSSTFPQPDWQKNAGIKVPSGTPSGGGRGVPDISADADPASGYDIMVDGAEGSIGGTSAVAPFLAAMTARVQQGLGASIGYLNPVVYQKQFQGAFNDVTQGNNGTFQAGPGWDAASGLGSPNGEKLLAALKAAHAAQAAATQNQALSVVA